MTFEPTAYQKTLLAILQDAWMQLRECVIHIEAPELRQRLLFHVDECLNWSEMRHLPLMKSTLLSIYQVAHQQNASEEVKSAIDKIRVLMNSLFTSLDLDWQI